MTPAAKVEWIRGAILEIFGDATDNNIIMDGAPSTGRFLTELENYDFAEFFRQELEDSDEAETPATDDNEDDLIDFDEMFSRLERFYIALMDYSDKPGTKPSSEDPDHYRVSCTWTSLEKNYMPFYVNDWWFSIIHDMQYYQLGKIFSPDPYLMDYIDEIEFNVAGLKSRCEDDELSSEELKEKLKKLKDFIDVKKFDDGFASRRGATSLCKPSNTSTTNKCMCECHKDDKLFIFNIYELIKMVEKDPDIQRFGDIYNYYYNDVFLQHPDAVTESYWLVFVNKTLSDEINTFEREVLKDLR